MKQVHILLVEDNEGDILLITDALEEGEIAKDLSVVKNGKDALDFIKAVASIEEFWFKLVLLPTVK